MNFVDCCNVTAESFGNYKNSFVIDSGKTLFNFFVAPLVKLFKVQTMYADFQTADCFQECAFKSAVDAHDFARRFHLRA